tara:strand:+ start:1707 stop:1949 length:243 start_codon:yes stop_codon:yes gene_type:complete
MKVNIKRVVANWRFIQPVPEIGQEGYSDWDEYEVGKHSVQHISECREDNNSTYNVFVIFEDGTSVRVFNINSVFYDKPIF